MVPRPCTPPGNTLRHVHHHIASAHCPQRTHRPTCTGAPLQDHISADHLAQCWNDELAASGAHPEAAQALESPLSAREAGCLIAACRPAPPLLPDGPTGVGGELLPRVPGAPAVAADVFVKKVVQWEAHEKSQMEVRPPRHQCRLCEQRAVMAAYHTRPVLPLSSPQHE